MKTFLSKAAWVLVAALGGYLITQLETGGLSQIWRKDAVVEGMALLADNDPFIHAVLSDHMNEAEPIMREALKNGDMAGLRQGVTSLVMKHGIPATARAGDASLLAIIERAREFLDVLADQNPDGCKAFATGDISITSLSSSQLKASFRAYSEARRVAYEDGKPRPESAGLAQNDLADIMLNTFKITEADAKLLQHPEQNSSPAVCALLSRIYQIKPVLNARKASYARFLIEG